MGNLAGFFENENKNIDLIPSEELNGFLGDLAAMPRNSRVRTNFVRSVQKNATAARQGGKVVPTHGLTAKAEFEKRISMLPEHIKKDLASGTLQIVDQELYAVRAIGGQQQVEILQNADDKEVGRTNVNARKLEKDAPFLCTALVVTSGIGATGDNSIGDIGATGFSRMPYALMNGEFSLEVGKKSLISDMAMEVFNTRNMSNVREGYYKLENPKWIEPQTEIIFEVKTPVAADPKTYIKVQFVGATVAKA